MKRVLLVALAIPIWLAHFVIVFASLFVAGTLNLMPESFTRLTAPAIVDGTTFLNDAKVIYGALQNQVSTLAVLINLFGDGAKFGKPISDIGLRGWTFGARMGPNYAMGYRKEGVGGVGAAGNQNLKQSTVFLKYAYVPITITGQAENLTKGQGKAFMQAKALEAKFDMLDITKHVNQVIAGGERGGQIAQVSASGAGTFTASAVGQLPRAFYLRPNMPVDAGPVGGGANSISAQTLLTVNYTTGVVTHAAGTATVGHAIYLAGEAPLLADFPLTAECLVSLVSDTQILQGLDPSQADQVAWKSFVRDAGGVDWSPLLLTTLKMMVKNRGGNNPDMFLVPSAQIARYVGIATGTIKYDIAENTSNIAKKAIDLGFSTFNFAGTPMIEEPDQRQDRIYCGVSESLKKFEAIPLSMADDEAGSWTRVSGANGIADAVQGLLRWYHQLGITCRADWGVMKNFTVIADFDVNPSTLA